MKFAYNLASYNFNFLKIYLFLPKLTEPPFSAVAPPVSLPSTAINESAKIF